MNDLNQALYELRYVIAVICIIIVIALVADALYRGGSGGPN